MPPTEAESAMPPGNHTLNRDQIVVVRFDPTIAAKIYRRKERPAKRKRQKILTYLGRDGEDELFEIRQGVPASRSEERLPSPGQLDAIHDFYGIMLPDDACHQVARDLLCARDYAEAVASSFSFTAQRRALLTRFIAAYLVHDPLLCDSVRRWCRRFEQGRDIRAGIAHDPPYKKAKAFAEKLILDLRGAGAEIFG